MEVRDRQKLLLSFGQPVGPCCRLAFWAGAASARVIQDDAMPAVILLDVPTERGSAAVADVPQGLFLRRREDGSRYRQKVGLMFAEDIGQFQPMLVHRLGRMVWTSSTGSSSSRGLVGVRTAKSATDRKSPRLN